MPYRFGWRGCKAWLSFHGGEWWVVMETDGYQAGLGD